MSNPWGKVATGIGSWAAEAEREEAELQQNAPTTTAAAATTANPQLFPSLKEAVTTKPKKKKMPLSEFVSSGSTRLTPDEMLQLPTAPKPRDPDEYSSGPRLGGGFSSYGDDRRRPRRGGDFDNEITKMPPPPSRADEVDNWGSMKKPISDMGSSRSSGGSASSRYGQLGGGSRADEVDNWNFGKKPQVQGQTLGLQSQGSGGRLSGFVSGNRDSGSDWRRGGGDLGGAGGERPRLVLNPPSERNGEENNNVVKKANPFGVARPREEVLAEKGLDWKKFDMEIEAKKVVGSRPSSSQGSRPTSSQSSRGGESVGGYGGGNVEVKARPKVNPFGDAKPREVLLEEKGLDWRKMDLQLEHRRVERPETEEEKALKEEIENLKKELNKSGEDVSQESEGEQVRLHDLIQSKERELEDLTRDLDDKVRFGEKAVEKPNSRPGSSAGRYTSFPERPPSQSGSVDDVRGPEVMDRPRSRGTGDVWTRPGENRRGGFQGSRDRGGFQGSRDRGGYQGGSRGGFQGGIRGGFHGGRDGFLGSREFDRSRSGERW